MTHRDTLAAKVVHAANNLVLSVAPVDAVRGKHKEVVFASDDLTSALWVRDNQVLHLEVAKCATYAQLTVDAIMEDGAVGSLDRLTLILVAWAVLRVELHPAAILAS